MTQTLLAPPPPPAASPGAGGPERPGFEDCRGTWHDLAEGAAC